MMPQLFGEFLVSRGLITEGHLLECIMEQVVVTPPIALVVYEHELLPAKQLLTAFALQAKTKKAFKACCEDLGYWSPAIEAEVERVVESSRLPIGQILLQKGILSVTDLTSALDEFHVERSRSEGWLFSVEPAFGELGSSGRATLSEVFTDEVRSDLALRLESISVPHPEGSSIREMGLPAFHAFHLLFGLFGYLSLGVAERVAGRMDSLLGALSAMDAIPAERAQEVSRLGCEALEVLWRLRAGLLEGKTEKDLWETMKSNVTKTGEGAAQLLEQLRADATRSLSSNSRSPGHAA